MLKTIKNNYISLSLDSYGGALVDLHQVGEKVNPLKFAFTRDQMPENNKNGAVYQGHFACIGRWGSPSEGEIKKGVPSHGDFANISWTISDGTDDTYFGMFSLSQLEGLKVDRKVSLERGSPVFKIQETVTNINTLGRPFNIVQHPTITMPFLNADTIVDCNGREGFRQKDYKDPEKQPVFWPGGRVNAKVPEDLRNPKSCEDGIFSYVVDKEDSQGWLTCYSPEHKTLFGYLWQREDYPWLHFWTCWEGEVLKYRALEFGTAGIHQPYEELLQFPRIFGVKTCSYIDAGESLAFSYRGFLVSTEKDIEGVSRVSLEGNELIIECKKGERYAFPVTS